MRFAPAFFLPAVLALVACGGPVPPTADAAWTVNLAGGGTQCNLANSTRQFGDIGSPADPTIPTSVTDQVQVCMTSDGYSVCPMGSTPPASAPIASVSCAVWQAGAAFGVHGSASVVADVLTIDIASLPTGASQASPATGTVTYVSDATVSLLTSSMCNFYFASDNQGVGLGKVWVAFTCPQISIGGTMGTCMLSESYAGFGNCVTSNPNG
jgi:hypothetical protein